MLYLGTDDPKAEFDDTLTQMMRELGIRKEDREEFIKSIDKPRQN
jgi:hypothetical protein